MNGDDVRGRHARPGVVTVHLLAPVCEIIGVEVGRAPRVRERSVGSLARLSTLPNPSWWQRVILWATRHGDFAIFLALCAFQDPFITTAYFRRGRFDGITARDWRLFLASVFVSNLYWTLRSGAVAAILVGAWRVVSSS